MKIYIIQQPNYVSYLHSRLLFIQFSDSDWPKTVTGCCGRSVALKKGRARGVSKSYSALNEAVDCLDVSSEENDVTCGSYDRNCQKININTSKETMKNNPLRSEHKVNYQPAHCVKNLVSWVSSVGNKVGKETMAFIDTLPSLKEDYHVVTIGLDSAGKTTVLYRLKFDQYVNTVPTIGFNCEKVKGSIGHSKNLTFLIWDVGGQEKLRPLWRPYTRATDAIIFVVDSCDKDERMEEARLELHRIMRTPDNNGVPLLVIANKQDLPSAKSENEIEKCLGLSEFNQDQLWHIEPACAVTGEGLESSLEALHTLIMKRKQQKKRLRNKTR